MTAALATTQRRCRYAFAKFERQDPTPPSRAPSTLTYSPMGSKQTAGARNTDSYRRMTVLWHESIDDRFDPVGVIKSMAASTGFLIRESTSASTGRVTLRVDTRESKATKGKGVLVDKATRRAAAKLLRKALRDPAQANRIRSLIQRQEAGEDVSSELAEALVRQG
jgi:hypothetical protein